MTCGLKKTKILLELAKGLNAINPLGLIKQMLEKDKGVSVSLCDYTKHFDLTNDMIKCLNLFAANRLGRKALEAGESVAEVIKRLELTDDGAIRSLIFFAQKFRP